MKRNGLNEHMQILNILGEQYMKMPGEKQPLREAC